VRDALERREHELREAAHEREKARLDEGEVALLLADADRADRDREPRQADAAAVRAAEIYDSVERRLELAASLDGRADAETIEARVVADTNQARPAHDAVANGPRRAPAGKRTRGKTGQVRSKPRRSERGR
jgi:colicin import membrane protein